MHKCVGFAERLCSLKVHMSIFIDPGITNEAVDVDKHLRHFQSLRDF